MKIHSSFKTLLIVSGYVLALTGMFFAHDAYKKSQWRIETLPLKTKYQVLRWHPKVMDGDPQWVAYFNEASKALSQSSLPDDQLELCKYIDANPWCRGISKEDLDRLKEHYYAMSLITSEKPIRYELIDKTIEKHKPTYYPNTGYIFDSTSSYQAAMNDLSKLL